VLCLAEWDLETRHQGAHEVLRALTLGLGNEVDVESVHLRVGVDVALDLREEAHRGGVQADAHDTGDCGLYNRALEYGT